MKTYEEILEGMRRRYRELAGFEADAASDIGIRLQVLAWQVHALCGELEALRGEVFPQTSTGAYLELHAGTRGLSRKAAAPAEGVLRFSRETPSASDIPIAGGVICATRPDPQVQFVTTRDGVLQAGERWVEIPARAAEPGAGGNVAADSVCLMVSAAPGITGVENPDPFSGGSDAESDEELRSRLLHSYSAISNGTNAAYYYDIAMSYDGVRSARVIPRARGRGTVDVCISCHSAAEAQAVRPVLEEDLGRRKEINVDVAVKLATEDVVNLAAEIDIRAGYDYSVVAEECRRALAAFLDGLEVGESLLLARAGSVLMEVDGVYNYAVTSPAADRFIAPEQVIRPGSVTVRRMEVVPDGVAG